MFVKSRPNKGKNTKLDGVVLLGDNMLQNVTGEYGVWADCIMVESKLRAVDALDTYVANSTVELSILDGAKLVGCRLFNCDISGATLLGVKASDIAVHRGVWERAPVTRIVQTSKELFTVTECTEGHIDINCMCHPAEKWLGGAGDRYLRIRGFSEEDAGRLRLAVKEVMDERDRIGREGN